MAYVWVALSGLSSVAGRAKRSDFTITVYALTAYILAQNKLIDAKQVINAETLPKVEMPNRNGFIPKFPERMPPN